MIRNELITADYRSAEGVNFGVHLRIYLFCQPDQLLITRKTVDVHAGNLSRLVSPYRCVHVMLHSLGRQNDVSDINFVLKASRDSCIDYIIHMKIIHQNLCAHCGIYLSDTALHHNGRFSLKNAAVKLHSCLFPDVGLTHQVLQLCYFRFHSSDNSN